MNWSPHMSGRTLIFLDHDLNTLTLEYLHYRLYRVYKIWIMALKFFKNRFRLEMNVVFNKMYFESNYDQLWVIIKLFICMSSSANVWIPDEADQHLKWLNAIYLSSYYASGLLDLVGQLRFIRYIMYNYYTIQNYLWSTNIMNLLWNKEKYT